VHVGIALDEEVLHRPQQLQVITGRLSGARDR
jgi:hypothetical protein